MKLRRLLVLVPLCAVPPSSPFQPTLALFPPPPSAKETSRETKNRRRQPQQPPIDSAAALPASCVASAKRTPSSLRASTVLPPPPLFTGRRREPPAAQATAAAAPARHPPKQAAATAPPPLPAAPASSPGGLFRPRKTQQERRKQQPLVVDEAAYRRRKEEWASKYTSVDALRRTFGPNRNGFLGDLDPRTTRRLYKTLLPRALLELYKMGVRPEDLAPLAYRARVAAKLYARERCSLPFRVAADLYDGFRQWRRYGSFDTHGMTFQQVWEKYSASILEQSGGGSAGGSSGGEADLTADDVTAQICLKILERSCKTNELVDGLFLGDEEGKQDLDHFTQTLEQDVRRLLQPVKDGAAGATATTTTAAAAPSERELQRFRTLRRVARIRRRLNQSLHRSGGPAAAAAEPGSGGAAPREEDAATRRGRGAPRPRLPIFGGAAARQ